MVDKIVFNAILAMDSYNRGYDNKFTNDSVGLGDVGSEIGNAIVTQESDKIEKSPSVNASFYAVAYNYNGETIISYRGTDKPLDIVTGWLTGGGLIGDNFITLQASLAAQFYNAVIGGESPYSSNVSFTGHSLGAGLAGLMASLYGKEAVIFDNMPFERAADNINFASSPLSLSFDQTIKDTYYFNGSEPQAPNEDKIDAYATTGEPLAPFRIQQSTDVTYLDSNAVIQNPGDLHSQALLVNLLFAQKELEAGNITNDWINAGPDFINALFDDAIAISSGSANADVMLSKIAYSAINEGTPVFGTTAIRAMFDDANDLGKALEEPSIFDLFAPSVSDVLKDKADSISKIFVEYASYLANKKEIQNDVLDGVLKISDDSKYLTVDFTDSDWAGTELFNTSIIGRSELFDEAFPLSTRGDLSSEEVSHYIFSIEDGGAFAVSNVAPSGKVNVIYGSDGNDHIIGSSGNDYIFGEDDFDHLEGGGGDDVINAGSGGGILSGALAGGIIDGGVGNDTADFSFLTRKVDIDLSKQTAVVDDIVFDDNYQLLSIENAIGGSNDDVIKGNGLSNTLDGRGGEDTIEGGGGVDNLIGGKDNDTLDGGIGYDTYQIAQSGDGIDTIIDEDRQGLIVITNGVDQALFSIIGTATPVSGGTGGKQFYEIPKDNIKLEYDPFSKILNINDWDGRGANDKIIINDFDQGDLGIYFGKEELIVPEPITPELGPITPPPEPEPTPPAPDTDGSSDTLLSVQAVNQTIDVGTRMPLVSLFPFSGWVDNDGENDITSFAVADRTPGGGYLEVGGVQATAGEVYEFRVTDIINWYFVAGPSAAVDEIGFNIIQANGDYSPRLEPGAIVTTVIPTTPVPDPNPSPGPNPSPTGGGSNLAALSFASTSTGASSGGEVVVTYTVKNIGDVTSARGKADIVLASTPDLQTSRRIGDDFNIPELDPGEERTYHRTVDVPISGNGNYFFGVDVRSTSLGHNRIESDDTASIPFQIGPGLSGNPDLRPGFRQPDEIFTQGVANSIDFTISTNNNGSPQYDYRVVLSRDDIAFWGDGILIDSTSSRGLGFHGTRTHNETITIPNHISDGLYYLIVQADPYARISETREDNNNDAEQIVVVSRPADDNELFNFVGSHVDVETDVMEVGQSYNIKSFGYMDSVDDAIGIIENGVQNIIKVKIYLSEDNIFDTSDIPFKTNTYISQDREIGQILGTSNTFPLPQWIDSGDYYLFAVFDPDNEFAEDFEFDNVTSGTNVTIVNNLTRTVSAGDDTIDLVEGETLTIDILSNDTTSISQDLIVRRFEGDSIRTADTPFVSQTQSGLGYSIDRDGTLILDATALNFDLQPGEVRTETFRYDLRGQSDGTSDLGVVTVSIRDPESDTIQVTPNDVTVKETDGQIEFTITRSGDRLNTEETLYISTTEDHSSINNNDYVSLLKQPLTFGIGEETKVVPVNILSDSTAELDDTFGLIVQTDPNDPTSTFFTSTTFTIQEDLVARNVSPNTKLYPGHTLGEFANLSAFAALKNDGSVVVWGDPAFGGYSSKIASDLNGTIDVTQIYSNEGAFAALRADGSVITWGSANHGGIHPFLTLQNVTQIYSTTNAFAALNTDGSVDTWGDLNWGGNIGAVLIALDGSVDVTQVYSNESAFAALRADGSVVTWGDPAFGGDSSSVASDLDGTVDVTQIYSTENAFAAVRTDGSVVTWGNDLSGGNSSLVAHWLDGTVDITRIISTKTAFAALRADGSAVTWGQTIANDPNSIMAGMAFGPVDIVQIYSNEGAFALLYSDGSVSTEGDPAFGSLIDHEVFSSLVDVKRIYTTSNSFAFLKADGSVVTSGDPNFGGDSSRVASDLDGTIDVTQIYSNDGAFAALRADGSVITWGSFDYGGAQSAFYVPQNVIQIFSTANSFAALHTDGSITTWGDENGGGDSGAVHSQLRSGVIDLANIYTNNDAITSISGDSIFFVDSSTENVVLEDGNKLIGGTPEEIDGVNIENFGTDDLLFISGVELQQSDLSVTKGSAILSLDTDDDDISDTVITLEGDFRLESFIVVGASSSGSYIKYLGNAVPVGEDDNITTLPEGFATDEDSAFTTANVLTNDNDGDGDTLSVAALDMTGTLGLVIDNGDGTFNYDPNGAFENLGLGETDTDSFVYTVSDGNGDSDTATVTVTINGVDEEPTLNPITGTTGRDILTGTPADDIIHSLGGSIDRMSGKAGADIFVFGAETNNGVRERDIILDYEVGIDSILLEDGASVGSIRQTSSGVAIFLEGDRDAIYVQGDGVLVGNLTFIPEDIILG